MIVKVVCRDLKEIGLSPLFMELKLRFSLEFSIISTLLLASK